MRVFSFLIAGVLASVVSAKFNVVVWSVAADELAGKFDCLDAAVENGAAIHMSKNQLLRPAFLPPGIPWPVTPGTFFMNPVNFTQIDCTKYSGVCLYYARRHAVPESALTWEMLLNLEVAIAGATTTGFYGNVSYYKFHDEADYREHCNLDTATPDFDEARGGYPSHIVTGCVENLEIFETYARIGHGDVICTDEERHSLVNIGNIVRNIHVYLAHTDRPDLISDNPGGFRSNETYYSYFASAVPEGSGLPRVCAEIPLKCDPATTGTDLIMMARYNSSNVMDFVVASQATSTAVIDNTDSNVHVTLERARLDGSAHLNRGLFSGGFTCANGVAALFEQCGGNGWTGPDCCGYGSKCVFINEQYSQCHIDKLDDGEVCGGTHVPQAKKNPLLVLCKDGLECKKLSPHVSTCQPCA